MWVWRLVGILAMTTFFILLIACASSVYTILYDTPNSPEAWYALSHGFVYLLGSFFSFTVALGISLDDLRDEIKNLSGK